jgi:DNA-binding SARP family transcriptional activator
VWDLRFELLGTLLLVDGADDRVAVPGARQRALLASLLLSANVPVSSDALIEAVWDGSPPPGAVTTLRSHVRRLRAALGPEGTRITAADPGYLISVQEPELDVLAFKAACRDCGAGRQAARWLEASAAGARALEQWRGTPLLDVPSQVLRDQYVPGLEQLRLQALEDRAEADLRLGRQDRLIPELRALTAQHPMRERFHAQLMEALAWAGRQAEALDAYRQARRVLAAELGIEPGPHLQLLHQQILGGDRAVAAPPASRDGKPQPSVQRAGLTRRPAGVPRQLPGAVPQFTGRTAELARLSRMLDQTGDPAPGTMVISAIGGTAGVGKTALAVHWAHRMARRFPDGQLYVNLRGFDPSSAPITPGEAICGFLTALGVPADRVPASLAAQAGLYRSLLAGRQLLILLDNVRDEQQVRPLLPGTPGCLVLVTSRSQLSGLVAAENASLLRLDVLSPVEGRQMLTARLGDQRTAAELDAVTEITELCARLPLALAVAAASAAPGPPPAARPRLPLAALAAELRSAGSRLDVLDTGDPAASVRAVFSWSSKQLSSSADRMFRLLGLHPGPDITVGAAASLAGAALASAHSDLTELTRAHLLTEHVPARYAFHDLLRTYSAEQADIAYDKQTRRAAVGRILDHYVHTAHEAALLIAPAREQVTLAVPGPGVTPEHLADSGQALTWFEAEHRVLLVSFSLAAETGFDAQAWQLPWAMAGFLTRRGYWREEAALERAALAAAGRLGDVAGQAISGRLLGAALTASGDYDQARSCFADCLTPYQELGDQAGQARVHQNLSFVTEHQGDHHAALGHAKQALYLFQRLGHRAGEGPALNSVGWCYALLGDYEQAKTFCRQSVEVNRELGNRNNEAAAWDSLGYAEYHLGNLTEAAQCYRQALSLAQEAGDRFGEAETLTHLGDNCHSAGELPEARDAWQRALSILDDLQHPHAEHVRARLSGNCLPAHSVSAADP